MVVAHARGEAEIAYGDFVFDIQRVQTTAFALGGAAVIQVLFLIVGIIKLITNAQTVIGCTRIKMRRVFQRTAHGFNLQLCQPIQSRHRRVFGIVQIHTGAVDIGFNIEPIIVAWLVGVSDGLGVAAVGLMD